MRVISGSAGSIPLRTSSHDVRPTMDMVREAIFSALGNFVIGARVLDLFAGSGAFGIEALSRGAAEAVFVDNHPKAIESIQFNLAKTRLKGKVIRQDAFGFLKRFDGTFNLIFADPPYARRPGHRNYALELVELKELSTVIDPEGILVLERYPEKTGLNSSVWEVTRAKKYGKTEVVFCVPARKSDAL
jgi:16S rRNA (guanine966-N2)-methyltransferase